MSQPPDDPASPAPQDGEPLASDAGLASEELEVMLARRRSSRWRVVQVALSLLPALPMAPPDEIAAVAD